MDINTLSKIQAKYQLELLKKANVVSIGIGYKTKNGQKTDKLGIIVGVTKKLPVEAVSVQDAVPQMLDGADTDVQQTGTISALTVKLFDAIAQGEFNTIGRYRPPMPGISIGHKNITAGTFGCVVTKNGVDYILSNNHVLANSNDALIGDAIFQPGPYDGGTSEDTIATLYEFVPIVFTGGDVPLPPPSCGIAKNTASVLNKAASVLGRSHRLVAYDSTANATTNYVDAALALPTVPVSTEIVEIGTPTGVGKAEIGMQVQKFGRTTFHTIDTIQQINVTSSVSYGTNQVAVFYGQLMAGPMSDGGDSGSAVLDMDKKVVGLLFAGSDTTTIINPIEKVLELLGVTVRI